MLDLKKLLDGTVSSVEFSVDVDDPEYIEEVLSGSAKAVGEITNRSGLILLKGVIEPDFKVSCARCGKEFFFSDKIALEAKITDKLANKDEDEFVLLTDFSLDIDELVRSTLILEMPSRFLCREDCKGLCPKCGCNLNESSCSCERVERDPRWDVLKDYFGD